MEDKILPRELKLKIEKNEDFLLIDVRNPEEHNIARISNSILMPINEIEARMNEIPKNKEIIIYCHHGKRSAQACEIFKSKGFNAKSLVGGIDVWSRFIDSSVPQY